MLIIDNMWYLNIYFLRSLKVLLSNSNEQKSTININDEPIGDDINRKKDVLIIHVNEI